MLPSTVASFLAILPRVDLGLDLPEQVEVYISSYRWNVFGLQSIRISTIL